MAAITLRIEDEKKKQFQQIPFDISISDPFFSKENQDAIEIANQQIREGKIVVKTMDELEAMANE